MDMAETKNWIEKAAEEINDRANLQSSGYIFDVIAKYAPVLTPVVDAQKIAKKICHQHNEWNQEEMQGQCLTQAEHYRLTAQLITDNIELDITWVEKTVRDSKAFVASWGDFELFVYKTDTGWNWEILMECEMGTEVKNSGNAPDQKGATKDCVDALKRIVTGGKG